MSDTFTRLPPLRSLNRNLLLVGLTVLLWTFDLAWDLAVSSPGAPQAGHAWRDFVGPRVVQHLLLLPLLVFCYMAAMQIPRLLKHPLPAFLAHASLGIAFASVARPSLFISNLLVAGDINAGGTSYHSLLEAGFNPEPWFSYGLVNFMVYLLGLFIILGVNARLDLEKERIRTSDLYALWLNARLDTLRGQLNPHFLFNSLHTISSLLFTDTHRADKLLADFSDVLRITLRDGQREFASVREELDYVRRYLSIEETRFEDRLTTRFDVDESSLGARVPSLILQPLIENAIKHGISNCSGANHVTVEARCGGDTLVLEVSNDFRPEAQPVSPERGMGIGLSNVRERLATIYGADYILSSQSLPGHRWSSRICIPFERAG